MYSRGKLNVPFGTLTVVVSDNGLRYVMFDEDAHPKSLHELEIKDDKNQPMLKRVISQLEEYFAGTRTTFDVPLDLHGTEFQVAAWRSLAEVPFGATRSYGEQAVSIGRPKAVRAIGSANSRNPVPIVLACHRIIGADGSLTGFGGGLPVKKWLLQHEADVITRAAI